MKYLLPCSCGQTVDVEPSQAGQTVTCRCGKNLLVPTLMQILQLEEAPQRPAVERIETGNMRRAFFLIGIFVFLAACVFLCWVVVKTQPKPRDVSFKRVQLTYNGMELFQDSTPIPMYEHEILWIKDTDIEAMPPMMMYFYYTTLKDPNFSINFHENYQGLKDKYHIRLTAAAVLCLLGLCFLFSSFFMPKRNAVVEGWTGTEW